MKNTHVPQCQCAECKPPIDAPQQSMYFVCTYTYTCAVFASSFMQARELACAPETLARVAHTTPTKIHVEIG